MGIAGCISDHIVITYLVITRLDHLVINRLLLITWQDAEWLSPSLSNTTNQELIIGGKALFDKLREYDGIIDLQVRLRFVTLVCLWVFLFSVEFQNPRIPSRKFTLIRGFEFKKEFKIK